MRSSVDILVQGPQLTQQLLELRFADGLDQNGLVSSAAQAIEQLVDTSRNTRTKWLKFAYRKLFEKYQHSEAYLLSVSSTTPGKRSMSTWQFVWRAGLIFTSNNQTYEKKRYRVTTWRLVIYILILPGCLIKAEVYSPEQGPIPERPISAR